MSPTVSKSEKHKGIQLSGLLLWRFGLLLATSAGIYRTLKFLLEFVELPLQLEIGIGLMAAGGIFFFLSLVAERLVAKGSEGDLRKDIIQ